MKIIPKSDIAKIKVPTMEQHKRWGEELKYVNNVLGHLCIDIENNAGIKYGDELHNAIDHISKLKNILEAKMSSEHEEWNEDGKGLDIYYVNR